MQDSAERAKPPSRSGGRIVVVGGLQTFLAEALFPLTALLSMALLTRWLGPAGYGHLALCAAIIGVVEFAIGALFTNATIQLIAKATDWRPIATKVLQVHLLASVGAMACLWLLAPWLAWILAEEPLEAYLRLFSFHIPLVGLAATHRNLLLGTGRYRQQALAIAARWTARLLLIIVLVGLGLSVEGAILASIGASLAELVIGRVYVRPRLVSRSTFPTTSLVTVAVPAFLSVLSFRVFRLDLLAFKVLGATAAQAGLYGAAQSLCLVLTMFAGSISQVLLSALARALRDQETAFASELGRNTLRLVFLLLPFTSMAAGASSELVGLIFGGRFLPAAPVLAVLTMGAVPLTLIVTCRTLLIAGDRARWAFALTGPMVPVALLGHLVMIPRLGALGASLVTTVIACLFALPHVHAICRLLGIRPPLATLGRAVLISALSYAAASLVPAPQAWVLVKLAAIGLGILLLYLVSGELSADDKRFLRGLAPRGYARATE